MILVFETSKTAYDVEADAEGYIEYACVAGNDYEVDTMVARIVSRMEEIQEAVNVSSPVSQTTRHKR